MGKNILIFADGTGNEGGLLPDESRTNVYKLFRATRPGPDTIVDPAKQIAFYVPGIGTPTIRHNSLLDRTKETVRQCSDWVSRTRSSTVTQPSSASGSRATASICSVFPAAPIPRDASRMVEGRITVDPHYMRLHPSSDGMMHDECMVGVGGTSIRWSAAIPPISTRHSSTTLWFCRRKTSAGVASAKIFVA
jgi:hypothetical protein